jgi:hypothetical protein
LQSNETRPAEKNHPLINPWFIVRKKKQLILAKHKYKIDSYGFIFPA